MNSLAKKVGAWSKEVFGDQESYLPFLGIFEELLAELDSDAEDALADAMIFSLDFGEREGLDSTPTHKPVLGFRPALKHLGLLAQALLKSRQKIKGLQDQNKAKELLQKRYSEWLGSLIALGPHFNVNIEHAAEQVFEAIVSKRTKASLELTPMAIPEYFKRKGIDPSIKPEPRPVPELADTDGMTTCPCAIEIVAVLFYSHVTVTFTDPSGKSHTFEGDSGGVGVGEIDGPGIIYYNDLSTLLSTSAFGVTFVSEDGGTAMVTWGSHGNANIVGIGEGLGAFGGSGDWK